MKIKIKHLHIALIIFGTIFLSLCAFHSSIWFDESYSVAIARHGFIDIWNITGNDVHPALYYWILHIIYLIFGNNIMIYRLFSVLCTAIVGILGYTHIRKDFGEKCGFFFSFLTYTLPVMTAYSQEIRMYSLAFLFVTVTAIYAYRYYKNVKSGDCKYKYRNLIIFGIFSVFCCYTHYYSLATTGIINLLLLIFLIKNVKQDKMALIYFLILAFIQIALYVPWLIYLMGQIGHVKKGFWIEIDSVSTPVLVSSFQFRRQLDSQFKFDAHTIIALSISLLLYIYLLFKTYKLKKEKQDLKPAFLGFIVYVGVIFLMYVASKILKQDVLFARYLFVMTGLYIFVISYMLSKEKSKFLLITILSVIVICGTISNITNMFLYYDNANNKFYEVMKKEIKENDIIVYTNIGNGGVVAALFPDNKQYFLCDPSWDVKEAYKAYAPGLETVYNLENGHDWSFLEGYIGRIWLVDSEHLGIYDEFPKDNIKILKEPQRIDTSYHEYIYNIMLLEKF